MKRSFPITRIYSDEAGESHFEDMEIPMEYQGEIGNLSALMPASGIIFREVKAEYDYDFHNAPQRQFIIFLDGEVEMETSLGEKRIFGPGQVILADDTTGKGHRTRNLLPQKRKSLFVVL